MTGQQIRRSQYILTYGPGSIIEGINGPCVMRDLDVETKFFNPKRIKKYEKTDARAKEILANIVGDTTPDRIHIFALPTNESEKIPNNYPLFETIGFPEWKICYNHNRHSENILYDGKLKKCPECNINSEGHVRFIRACPRGHMDDVDWNFAVHQGLTCPSRYFHWRSEGASLADIKISCPFCHREITMGEVYKINFDCTGRKPESRRGYDQGCHSKMAVLQRQSTSLRQSESITILEIPTQKKEAEGEDKKLAPFYVDEYEYVTGLIKNKTENTDEFCIEETKKSKAYGNIPPLEITPVSRLKTITIQYGYTRKVRAEAERTTVLIGKETSEKDGKWFPCFESIGEGVWITLPIHIDVLRGRDKMWGNHDESIESRFKTSDWWACYKSPLWAWYHTLSHALIKSISIYCGYSIASIRERVYLSRDGDAGAILLYTSSSGEDGSLGGLSGAIDFFDSITSNADEIIRICSNDPFCIKETKEQNRTNGSACHSCIMLSETSCEHGNRFIDRHLIKEAK